MRLLIAASRDVVVAGGGGDRAEFDDAEDGLAGQRIEAHRRAIQLLQVSLWRRRKHARSGKPPVSKSPKTAGSCPNAEKGSSPTLLPIGANPHDWHRPRFNPR